MGNRNSSNRMGNLTSRVDKKINYHIFNETYGPNKNDDTVSHTFYVTEKYPENIYYTNDFAFTMPDTSDSALGELYIVYNVYTGEITRVSTCMSDDEYWSILGKLKEEIKENCKSNVIWINDKKCDENDINFIKYGFKHMRALDVYYLTV